MYGCYTRRAQEGRYGSKKLVTEVQGDIIVLSMINTMAMIMMMILTFCVSLVLI